MTGTSGKDFVYIFTSLNYNTTEETETQEMMKQPDSKMAKGNSSAPWHLCSSCSHCPHQIGLT